MAESPEIRKFKFDGNSCAHEFKSLFPEGAVKSAIRVMENFTDLEFDLSTEKRGRDSD